MGFWNKLKGARERAQELRGKYEASRERAYEKRLAQTKRNTQMAKAQAQYEQVRAKVAKAKAVRAKASPMASLFSQSSQTGRSMSNPFGPEGASLFGGSAMTSPAKRRVAARKKKGIKKVVYYQ